MTTLSGRHPVSSPSAELGHHGSPPLLDYYLLYAAPATGGTPAEFEGILAEEFLLAEDHSAVGLVSAGWAVRDRRWCDASVTSQRVRADAGLRRRVVPVDRATAAASYRESCGDELPSEATLRAHFADRPAARMPAALRLSTPEARPGFRETRVYRILFANDLSPDGLAALCASWRMAATGTSPIRTPASSVPPHTTLATTSSPGICAASAPAAPGVST
ncbi:hypothetical protein [Salinispora arenicola]|uniref:hypothetical protein n=1 Tax=Salinispora arenicola TaxID=168697 RepID=UPI00037CABDE|nr:hypothetical protein [Salinispora arenicola]